VVFGEAVVPPPPAEDVFILYPLSPFTFAVVRTGSIKHACVADAVPHPPAGVPKAAKLGANPTPHVDCWVSCEVTIVRTEPTAEDSLAAMRARNRFGIAIAAMIKMIATTISNSISEKPF
jgi:hypothetical protein